MTKQMISDCFIDLLEAKPLNKITVVDICTKAEINRATFYRYYNSPYDLFESIEKQFSDEMQSYSELFMRAITGQGSMYEALIELLSFYKRNQKTLLIMQPDTENRRFPNKLLHDAANFINSTHGVIYPELSVKQYKRLFRYTAYGTSAVIYAWLEGGMKDSIEEMATFLVDCTEGVNGVILGKAH
jgi:AcrR family transcriptional regulator